MSVKGKESPVAYYRIYMVGVDDPEAKIELYAPVTDTGAYDTRAPKPHLVRARDSANTYYGELVVDGREAVFEWVQFPTSPTNLFATALKVGRLVNVDAFYNEHDGATFEVKALVRLN